MKILLFLLGFLSTLQIFKYKFYGANIYPFDLVYYTLIIVLFIKLLLNRQLQSKAISANENPTLIIFLFYYLFSVNFFIPLFDNANIAHIMVTVKLLMKKLIFLVFFLLIYYSKEDIKRNFIKYFVSGFFISVLFHTIYSYSTLYFWYFQKLEIHSIWLNILGITEQSVGHGFKNFIYYPILRTTGFHWDPAYFGLWGIIGIFFIFVKSMKLQSKFILILLIFIPWVFTFSRSAVFGLIAVILIIILISFRNKKPIIHLFNPVNTKSVLMLFFIMIPLVIFLSVSAKISFKDILISRIEVNEDVHTQKHLLYPFMAGKALLTDPLHFLFGYGNRNSGRAIAEDINAIQGDFNSKRVFDIESDLVRIPNDFNSKKAYDVESDLVRVPINTGILGFSFYLLFISIILFELMKTYIKNKNEMHLFIFLVICLTFFAGFFYAYNDSVWVWMFWGMAVILLQNSKEIHKSKNSLIRELNK